jgi:hypothetical protein
MLHVRPYVRKRSGAENDMPRAKPTCDTWVVRRCACRLPPSPAAPFATATMPNTGTNVAAAASTSARPPNTCEHVAKRARKAAVLKVRQCTRAPLRA